MPGMSSFVLEERPNLADVLFVLLCFVVPPATTFLTYIGREWGRLRRRRNLDRLEAEAMAAEGFPPPGPPTTDSEPQKRLT